MFGKKNIIKFKVDGKPPKKTTGSLWSENSKQTELVVNLRKNAFEASKKKGLNIPFQGPIKLTLTIYDPNPLERKDRHDYLGDLDSYIAGVFESLQPLPPEINKLKIDSSLKDNKEISYDMVSIVADDAQIASIIAKKLENKKPSYTVIIEAENPTYG